MSHVPCSPVNSKISQAGTITWQAIQRLHSKMQRQEPFLSLPPRSRPPPVGTSRYVTVEPFLLSLIPVGPHPGSPPSPTSPFTLIPVLSRAHAPSSSNVRPTLSKTLFPVGRAGKMKASREVRNFVFLFHFFIN